MAMDQNRGIPSEPQNSWQTDVHPTKLIVIGFDSPHIYIYIY